MNIYYVYAYLDPRKPDKFKYGEYEFEHEPFYIGKGKNSRLTRHLMGYDGTNPIKKNKINRIIKDGFNPIIVKIRENLTNEESLELEIDIIKSIGRVTRKSGPLTNFSKGGETFLGYKHKQDYIDILNRPVVKYDINGEFIEEYKSVKEAGKRNNMHPQTVSQICGGGIKIYKNEFIFKYEDEPFEIRVRDKKQYPVIRIDYNFNEKEYESLTKAAIENNLTPSNASSSCTGRVFQSGGYLWRYKGHPKLLEFNDIIARRFGKYLNIMDRKIKYNNIIYNNILHVIFDNKNTKVGNIYQLLNSNKKNMQIQ